MKSLIAVFGAAWFLVSCAHTNITSLRDPVAPTRAYRRILVALPINDLAERQLVENKFAADRDSVFKASYRVLFPGRTYTAEDLAREITSSGSDAVLVITLNGAGINHSTRTTSNGSSAASCSATGCAAAAAATTQTYDISKPWATFTAQLIDVQSGRSVWIATSESHGNKYAKANNLLTSMAETTIDRLRHDGLILTRTPPNER